MDQQTNNPTFPEQSGPGKIHGVDVHLQNDDMKEKYIRDAGKIEDYPSQDEVAKMNAPADESSDTDGLTDMSGEEKKEDYINTDERARDLEQRRHH